MGAYFRLVLCPLFVTCAINLVMILMRDAKKLVNALAADWDPLVNSNEFTPPRLVRGWSVWM